MLDGPQSSYYENGAMSHYTDMKDDKKHGLYEKYDENGTLTYSAHYIDDLLDGQCLEYEKISPESVEYYLKLDRNYIGGLLDGIMIYMHPVDILVLKIEYKEDQLHGIYESYVDGHIKFSGQTENNQAVGIWIEYDEKRNKHGQGEVELSKMAFSYGYYITKKPDWTYE